eukprot:m.141443 g.141443  ORF g.141443 m.141443 type:complete len:70 (-) comp15980_c0_seq1:1461-1670(-)
MTVHVCVTSVQHWIQQQDRVSPRSAALPVKTVESVRATRMENLFVSVQEAAADPLVTSASVRMVLLAMK